MEKAKGSDEEAIERWKSCEKSSFFFFLKLAHSCASGPKCARQIESRIALLAGGGFGSISIVFGRFFVCAATLHRLADADVDGKGNDVV